MSEQIGRRMVKTIHETLKGSHGRRVSDNTDVVWWLAYSKGSIREETATDKPRPPTYEYGAIVKLHGNNIAYILKNKTHEPEYVLWLSLAGHGTKLTRSRLNDIVAEFLGTESIGFYQKGGGQYVGYNNSIGENDWVMWHIDRCGSAKMVGIFKEIEGDQDD